MAKRASKIQPKQAAPRLPTLIPERMTSQQRALWDSIVASRKTTSLGGPFGVWLHAPAYGDLVQRLGAHCRYGSGLPPRLTEFTILVVAQLWRAQFEWYAHAPIAAKEGVHPQTIKDLQARRLPKRMQKDERAIYGFITELHKTQRVSDKTYARVHALFGDAGMVEFVGIIGYYTNVSLTLNAFRVPLPEGAPLPFRER
jgi:4-carboxymuconolactone decarboxylase